MKSNNATPPKINYTPVLGNDGHWIEPKPDAYLTIVTKWHGENGKIESNTWFHLVADLTDNWGWTSHGTVFQVTRRMPNGRMQTSQYPASEIIRVDFNGNSQEYLTAVENWHRNEFGVSSEEYVQMTSIERQEQIRAAIAKQTGANPDDIIFSDDGLSGAFRTPLEDDDES